MTGETLVLSNKSKAIGFILLSALGFAMMSVFVRLAGDLPFTQKSFFRNAERIPVGERESASFAPARVMRHARHFLQLLCDRPPSFGGREYFE